MIKMKIKKIIIAIMFILVILLGIMRIYAFSYDEDEQGNPFYELDVEVKVPSIGIRDLILLQPSTEPFQPELGMIYFDSTSKRLRLYDGTGWYSIALEKVSSVSKNKFRKSGAKTE
ncbi:unnamed protein product, partial [marine sediment metagenome]